MIHRCVAVVLVTLAFAALTLGPTPSIAYAADQVVNNCSNDTELRADLTALQSGGGTLTFNCSMTTISLTTQLPDINTNTTIDGGGKITLTGLSGVRLFRVTGLGTLTLKKIVLERGYGGSSDGGAIFNDGHLILDNATIQGSYTAFHGGAIFTHGRLDITNSTLASNIASSGAAIYADGINTQVTITGSTFEANRADSTNVGGAIYSSGPLSVTNSEFASNEAGSGGAIYARRIVASVTAIVMGSTFHDNHTTGSYPNANGAALLVDDVPVTIDSSTMRNNTGQSGGAIGVLPNGHLLVTDSTLRDNGATNGGGIYNKGAVNLSNVTISGSQTSHGGGIDNFGALLLTNVTLSGNAATYGGGLKNEGGTATLTNVTLSGNSAAAASGGGILNVGASTHLSLKNVIVANSPAGDNCRFYTTPDSLSFSLSSDGTCGFGTERDNVNLMLGPLANNGGLTQTHLPQGGSAAINNGTSSGAPSTDQRGVTRPQGAAFDVGSVEVAATPTATRTRTATSTRTPTPSPTATRTATPTLTATSTPTLPPVATATGTAPPIATGTRTPTDSSTSTRTSTAAATATATTPASTSTRTPSAALTSTPTPLPTATASATATPTATPTLTPPLTVTATPTQSASPAASGTPPPTPTPSHTATATPTAPTPATPPTTTSTSTATPTPTVTVTPIASRIPTPTATAERCGGDCGHDGEVTINELLVMVNVALGQAQVSECSAGDADGSGAITIDEILVAVNHALNGCG